MRLCRLARFTLLGCALVSGGAALASSDPLFSGPRAERNRQIFKDIQKDALYILTEYNAEKKFRGFQNEINDINKNLEVLFLGMDANAVAQKLRADTGSLQEVCFLNSTIDSLELIARSAGKTMIRKDLDTKLLRLSLPCLQKR